ncbi:acyclic terpene utilization AtuA family protein [Halotalea alkalilenta]|uniref:acyclic terpene utilization AtuA family protein n=1 Tax=Halotalea alkalilenta TaxID=376489 RepID=UPI0004816883|nr:acyclic terpene utilization AtuA family protein [Halotalea alkalilenta]
MSALDKAYIGYGAGFAGDRPEAAVSLARDLAARRGRRYLIFELLAERTLAEAQLRRRSDPEQGYASRLFRFIEPVLGICLAAGIPIITNGGAANPVAAAKELRRILDARGGQEARIACVLGDDLLDAWHAGLVSARARFPQLDGEVISCNVYSGAESVTQALQEGADVVICGRTADPSLAVGALCHAFRWHADDCARIAVATVAGHLLECCTQVSGGYFADPGRKDVPDPAHPGCPIAEVDAQGGLVITKTAGSGGIVDRRTVKEQLLYEMHDPHAYLTPDVVLDIGCVRLTSLGPDRVGIEGVAGRPRPASLKGIIGIGGRWFGEAEISYAGPGAVERAALAREILLERASELQAGLVPRIDLLGVAGVFNDDRGEWLRHCLARSSTVDDVRLRLAIVDADRQLIEWLLDEVEALYTNGPAGGGGVRRSLVPALRTESFTLPREDLAMSLAWH